MPEFERLYGKLQELLIANGGDINIDSHPDLINEAAELGLSKIELARKIQKIVETIDWKPYRFIDDKLVALKVQLKGNIFIEEVEPIIEAVSNELTRHKTVDYILSEIKKWGFRTRERNEFTADAFENLWMTDDAWAKYQRDHIVVEWLDQKVRSLVDVGNVSYKKTNDAKYYLRDAASLKSIIILLTKSASRGNEYAQIIESEPDIDKRYLKVIYRLNPALPYKLNNVDFTNIAELLDKTTSDINFFQAAANDYKNGLIHVWLKETDPTNAAKLTTDYSYNSFLVFALRINNKHGIYLGNELFATPESLVEKARTDKSYWYKIYDNIQNGILPIWFEGIGQKQWVEEYNDDIKKYINNFYLEHEIILTSVQFLLEIIDRSISIPAVKVTPSSINLSSLEGSKNVKEKINISLENFGFVKAGLYFEPLVDGVQISDRTVAFFSLTNTISEDLILEINPLKFEKDKNHSIGLKVSTCYGTITVPIEIKVIFPVRSYIIKMFTYAILGAILFGGIRFLLLAAADDNPHLYTNGYFHIGSEYYIYLIALLLLLAGLIGSYFIIRKTEKI